MTEAEFIAWCTENTWAEWVDGEVIVMNAVALDHADMFTFIIALLHGFCEEFELGKVLSEPYQIRLPRQRRRRSPDVFFVSNERVHLLEKTQMNGAPDLIVEIISPDHPARDRTEKYGEYEIAGVREYWLVDTIFHSFQAFSRNAKGKFEPLAPSANGEVSSTVLKGLFFRNQWAWQPKLPKVAPLVAEMSQLRKKLLSSRKRRSSDKSS